MESYKSDCMMERFKKDKLYIDARDSQTVQQLKIECNELIDRYNLLTNPLSELGQLLSSQINSYVMKLHKLKDLYY